MAAPVPTVIIQLLARDGDGDCGPILAEPRVEADVVLLLGGELTRSHQLGPWPYSVVQPAPGRRLTTEASSGGVLMDFPRSPRVNFPMGRQLMSRGVAIMAAEDPGAYLECLTCLQRHAAGDWGDLDADDHAANELALQDGSGLFSAYALTNGLRIWIITEADRSATTILFPHEY